ncbi:hypothetical protein DFJ74DRAFT_696319 [Hyaloraphidium curvatum]|nr:hypothetical protein DFJ74DRAFT_696319 [Hyaloraphidium curvatum]
MDRSPAVRGFAERYVYSKPQHADFFVTTVLITVSTAVSAVALIAIQNKLGYLPWTVLLLYYNVWLGLGGRMMGATYALTHREAHTPTLYRRSIRDTLGTISSDWVGLMYGNVPDLFATSHIWVHHKLNGAPPDTIYMWDNPRDSLRGFALFVTRMFHNLAGTSSLRIFEVNKRPALHAKLRAGMLKFWVYTPLVLLVLTRSPSFLFWIWLQPLLCMTVFLAVVNVSQHAFVEYDEQGKLVPAVTSMTVLDGMDDYWGEDNHISHHNSVTTYFRDLPEWNAAQRDEWRRVRASVFRGTSIVELSVLVLLGKWDELAAYYVDHSDTPMDKGEVARMLADRARRVQMRWEEYQDGPWRCPLLGKVAADKGEEED